MSWDRAQSGGGAHPADPSPAGLQATMTSAIRTCSIADCGQTYHAKGLCHNHYKQEWRRRSKGQPPQQLEPTPAVAICPDHLLPLITQAVAIDAARLFRVAWAWCGIEFLRTQTLNDERGAA